MNPRNHLRREMPDQHRTVDGRNDSARRIRRHVVFRKQRKSVDPVRHHFEIIKFRQVFRDKNADVEPSRNTTSPFLISLIAVRAIFSFPGCSGARGK